MARAVAASRVPGANSNVRRGAEQLAGGPM